MLSHGRGADRLQTFITLGSERLRGDLQTLAENCKVAQRDRGHCEPQKVLDDGTTVRILATDS